MKDYFTLIIFFMVISILQVLIYGIYMNYLESKYGKKGSEPTHKKMRMLKRFRVAFKLREDTLSEKIVNNYTTLKKLRRKYFLLQKELEELNKTYGQKNYMHRIHNEDNVAYKAMSVKMDKYVAKVKNKNIEKLVSQKRRHSWLLPIWKDYQDIVVWSSSVAAAKIETEKIYPGALGFHIEDIYIINEKIADLIEVSDSLDSKLVSSAMGMSDQMRKDMKEAENKVIR